MWSEDLGAGVPGWVRGATTIPHDPGSGDPPTVVYSTALPASLPATFA